MGDLIMAVITVLGPLSLALLLIFIYAINRNPK